MRLVVIIIICVAVNTAAAQADDPQTCHHCGHALHPEKVPRPGKPRFIPHTDERAGWPRETSPHAEPSITPGGIGYHVGGDTPFFGHGFPRRRDQGTWGWDETGHPWKRRRVILGHSHSRLHQGGTGRYATDGPHVPDPIASTVTRLRSAHEPAEADH